MTSDVWANAPGAEAVKAIKAAVTPAAIQVNFIWVASRIW
jgi:hypothetical protein